MSLGERYSIDIKYLAIILTALSFSQYHAAHLTIVFTVKRFKGIEERKALVKVAMEVSV